MATRILHHTVGLPNLARVYEELHQGTKHLPLLAGPLAAIFVWMLPLEAAPVQQKTLAIAALMVAYWIAEPFDHGMTALLGCYLLWALGVSDFSSAFSGFANSTPWFLFGALLMGEGASRTGLAKRIGYLMMLKAGSSPGMLLLGMVMLALALCVFIPSGMGRLAVLAPMALGIAGAYGLRQRRSVGKGLFLLITYICGFSELVVMSGASSILTRGIIEEQTGIQIFWSQWLIAFFPLTVMGIVVSIMVVRWLFPIDVENAPRVKEYFRRSLADMGPPTAGEKKALAWFFVAIGLWGTDFIHHTNPAVIALGIGIALSIPKIGVLDPKILKEINFLIIMFSAGALSLGSVLAETGTLSFLTANLVGWLQILLSGPVSYALILYVAGFLYHLILANRQSMLITSLPVLLQLGAVAGYNPIALSLVWTFAGGASLFIHQSGIYVMGYSYGRFQATDFIRFSAALTVIQGALLVLLVHFYWPLIGLSWLI